MPFWCLVLIALVVAVPAMAQPIDEESDETLLKTVVACRSVDDINEHLRFGTSPQVKDMIATKLASGDCVTMSQGSAARIRVPSYVRSHLAFTRTGDATVFNAATAAFTRNWARKTVLAPVLACRNLDDFWAYDRVLLSDPAELPAFIAARTESGACVMLARGETVDLDYGYRADQGGIRVAFARGGDVAPADRHSGYPGGFGYARVYVTYIDALVPRSTPAHPPTQAKTTRLTTLRPAHACSDNRDLFAVLAATPGPSPAPRSCVLLKQGEAVGLIRDTRVAREYDISPWVVVVHRGAWRFIETSALLAWVERRIQHRHDDFNRRRWQRSHGASPAAAKTRDPP
jgi:hypothetical protein